MHQSKVWRFIADLFCHDPWRKLVALFLALLLYMAIAPRTGEKREKSFYNVPVHIELPPHLALSNSELRKVKLVLSGTVKDLDNIDPGTLNIRAAVNADGVVPGQAYPLRLRAGDVSGLPYGVRVSSISPRDLPLDLEPVISKAVRVRPKYSGVDLIPEGYKIVGESFVPATVTLTGPAKLLNSINEIYTNPIHLDSQTTRNFEYRCSLDMLPGIRADRTELKVLVRILKLPITQKQYSVPIAVSQSAGNTRIFKVSELNPQSVNVVLKGPNKVLAMLKENDITALVDLNRVDKPGTYSLPLNITIANQYNNVQVENFFPANVRIVVANQTDGK